jgi:hypothetical protein
MRIFYDITIYTHNYICNIIPHSITFSDARRFIFSPIRLYNTCYSYKFILLHIRTGPRVATVLPLSPALRHKTVPQLPRRRCSCNEAIKSTVGGDSLRRMSPAGGDNSSLTATQSNARCGALRCIDHNANNCVDTNGNRDTPLPG